MIIAVTGTGTGVGKTHLACALIGALRDRGARAAGWKPIESGVADGVEGDDERRLLEASSATVAPTLRLRAPLAPNVAARRQGVTIDGPAMATALADLAPAWPFLVVELAGGLCSPFDDHLDNGEWLAQIGVEPYVIVVAPDRLGVLHDVTATLRAATAVGVRVRAVVLSAPAVPDESTALNLEQLFTRKVASGVRLLEVPHAPIDELRTSAALASLARDLIGDPEEP